MTTLPRQVCPPPSHTEPSSAMTDESRLLNPHIEETPSSIRKTAFLLLFHDQTWPPPIQLRVHLVVAGRSCLLLLLKIMQYFPRPREPLNLSDRPCVWVNSTHTITWHGLAAAAALEGKATNLGKVVVHVSSSIEPGIEMYCQSTPRVDNGVHCNRKGCWHLERETGLTCKLMN